MLSLPAHECTAIYVQQHGLGLDDSNSNLIFRDTFGDY